MIDTEVQTELLKQLEELSVSNQLSVLEFARSLRQPLRGTPGKEFLELCGTLPAADAEEMMRAIEEDCERIDLDGWK
jgi:hypothetical protein